jgi:hypothetical protein
LVGHDKLLAETGESLTQRQKRWIENGRAVAEQDKWSAGTSKLPTGHGKRSTENDKRAGGHR